MSAKEMFGELGYIQDKEPRFSSLVSYTKYCENGCCRINDLVFYKEGIETDDVYITYKLLKAINKQAEELDQLEEVKE